MTDDRIERALIGVARRYAPPLAPPGWKQPGDYRGSLAELARALAENGALVIVVEAPAGQSALITPLWTDSLTSLYTCLSSALFPSSTLIQAFYAESGEPPILLLYGASIPVIMVLSGYVLPYLAARQGANPPDDEVIALFDAALDWLEAGDLARADYLRLRGNAVDLLRTLLNSTARPVALAPATVEAPIPARTRPAPASLPEAKPVGSTPPPMTLPESPTAARPAPASLPEPGPPRPPLPVVFEPPARPVRRRPPLPE
ncbi:MAG: hypothetical protein U0452_14010 [Anaerolineae bacterium]